MKEGIERVEVEYTSSKVFIQQCNRYFESRCLGQYYYLVKEQERISILLSIFLARIM